MKSEKIEGSAEKRSITAMIVDKVVLARVADKWTKDGLFASKWANLVGRWCLDFFEAYNEAPKKEIRSIFQAWAEDNKDDDTVELVDRFLTGLSDDYATLEAEAQSEFVIDLAEKHFNKVLVDRAIEVLEGYRDTNQIDKAIRYAQNLNKLEIGLGSGIDVFQNKEAIIQAFESKHEPIIRYSGAAANFFEDNLERDAFIGVMAPEKRGKSWFLQEFAHRGVLQRHKVAMFQCGDMSQNQVMRRLMVRVAQLPAKNIKVKYPVAMGKNSDDAVTVTHEVQEYPALINWQAAWAACKELTRETLRSKQPFWKLSCHPSGTISVRGIENIINGWIRTGWVPDVVVIDYADILAAIDPRADKRDQINDTWMALRALSQKLHCLVITATQSNVRSYGVETMDMKNFSEDKRKFAHVTGMIGLNQTRVEKEQGVMRLNWVTLRENEYHEGRCVHVAGCLSLARPIIKSLM